MPAAHDPSRSDFYVYQLVAGGQPFYVGIGRSARASDRVRYVRYLLAREAEGKSAKWSLSGRAVAGLLAAGREVSVGYVLERVTRAEALVGERAEIARLLAEGHVLANIQHNPQRPRAAEVVVQAVLAKSHGFAPNYSFKPTPVRGAA